jgi:coiled-coil domain-containing protein 22
MVGALRASLDKQGSAKKFVRQAQERTGLQRAVAFDREASDTVLTETEEELEQRREQERQDADARYKEIEGRVKDAERKIQSYADEIRQMRASLQAELSRTADLKKAHDQLKTVMDLLPDAKNNIEKLRRLAQEYAEKIKTLAADWEKYRQPFLEEYRSIRDKMHGREEDAKAQLEKIKDMRAKMKDMVEEINKKDEKYKQLLEVFKTLPKDNRSNYTRRILEMVKNVKKQIVEINKILVDTKN